MNLAKKTLLAEFSFRAQLAVEFTYKEFWVIAFLWKLHLDEMKNFMTNIKAIFAIVIVLVLGCGFSGVGQSITVSISIVNPDFESQPIAAMGPIGDPVGCGTYAQSQIVGWTLTPISPGAGGGIAHWTCDDGALNSNVAFLAYGASMDQTLAWNPLTNPPTSGVYVLQFDVANWFYSYHGDWKAELYQGNSPAPFCSESGWAIGDMKRIPLTCPLEGGLTTGTIDALTGAGQELGNIRIHFQNGASNPALGGHSGWPILIDNVSLTFTPQ